MTINVTKKSVNFVQPKLNNIVFNLQLKDGENVLLDKDFSCIFRDGDSVADKTAVLIEEMQLEINRYKTEQNIFSNATLDNAVSVIKTALKV